MECKNDLILRDKLILLFYVIWNTPIIGYYTNTYIAMLVLLVLFLELVHIDRAIFSAFPIHLFFVFPYFIIYFCERVQIQGILLGAWSVFLALFPIIIGYFLISHEMTRILKQTMTLLICVYFITAITTYAGHHIYPNASRVLAFGTTETNSIYYKYNIGGYGFIYSLVMVHPILVCYFRTKRNIVLSILVSAITILCVVNSGYTVAILLISLSCIAYMFPINGEKGNIKKMILLSILIIILCNITSILDYFATFSFLGESALKIQDLSNAIKGNGFNELDMTIRSSLYQKSWDSFVDSFFIGKRISGTAYEIGGHSFILDTLAEWGVIGGLFFTLVYVYYIKMIKAITEVKNIRYYAYLSLVIAFVISLLNTGFGSYELGFVTLIGTYCCNSIYEDKMKGNDYASD